MVKDTDTIEGKLAFVQECAARFDFDYRKFIAGNHQAGVRARKALMEIKHMVTEMKKAMGTEPPTKAASAPSSEPASAEV